MADSSDADVSSAGGVNNPPLAPPAGTGEPAKQPSADYKALYASLETPQRCYADFCLIPVGTGSASVANEVAEVQLLLKASGLTYTMHSAGTTVEGTWDEVTRVIGLAHALLHRNGVVRVQTSMRMGTRIDKTQRAVDKVLRVEEILKQRGGS